MANCCEMKAGDVFVRDTFRLERKIKEAYTCASGDCKPFCNEPPSCCEKEMAKRV